MFEKLIDHHVYKHTHTLTKANSCAFLLFIKKRVEQSFVKCNKGDAVYLCVCVCVYASN